MYCIFLFLYAASLFGTLISQVTEIVASHAAMSKELDSILESYLAVHPRQGIVDSLVNFLRSEYVLLQQVYQQHIHYNLVCHSLDIETMFKIRGWERFRFLLDFEHRQV